jgi:pimeloyl-ACP methyl ester carboxylesterase
MLAPSFESWKSKGQFIEVNNHRLFVIDEGTADEVLVILHGYPSCSYDYYKVLPLLYDKYRVIIHDHLGFGLSEKPLNYSYSLIEQADMALALWQKLGLKEVHLLAHDYGTSVATEIVAQYNLGYEPVKLKTITLGNGSMHIEMAKLLPTQKLLRSKFWGPILVKFSTQWLFNRSFTKLWYDKSKIDQQEFDILWEMMQHNPEGRKVFPAVSRYLLEREKFWHRWIGGLHRTDKHINLLWADKDPIAIVAMAKKLHQNIPSNSLKILADIGHYPMLEAPEIYASGLIEMIENQVA